MTTIIVFLFFQWMYNKFIRLINTGAAVANFTPTTY